MTLPIQWVFAEWIPLDCFAELKWCIQEFEPDQPKLLLSDLPIHWEGRFYGEDFLIQPHRAGPRLLRGKVAGNRRPHQPASHGELIARINLTSIASSAQKIWAADREGAQALLEASRCVRLYRAFLQSHPQALDLLSQPYRLRTPGWSSLKNLIPVSIKPAAGQWAGGGR